MMKKAVTLFNIGEKPLKEGMNILGFNAGTPRAPLTQMEPSNREKLRTAMQNFGLECKA